MPPGPTRRRFLGTAVVGAGAALSGCGALPVPDGPDRVAAAGDADAGDLVADPPDAFPQSVASGDPRPAAVVLWTRVDPAADAVAASSGEDVAVRLQVAPTAAFSDPVVDAEFVAAARHDHCLRVKVVDLDPDTDYRYRFAHGDVTSPVGRTRTAPEPDADRPVAFGVASCQDRAGRYYNGYLPLLEHDLDFVVHLGDYVYETTADPSFQRDGADGRAVAFRDPADAIELEASDTTYLAARSLSNYRDLYRAYRSDPVLRRVHERFPTVHLWDDHEFSNDSWGAHATYTAGRREEVDRERRRNAERAFFEYLPVEPGAPTPTAGPLPGPAAFPDTRLYRDLRFGRHVHLALTDYRTYRRDHLVPEDAFPGRIVLDRDAVVTAISEAITDRGFYETVVGGPDDVLEDWLGFDLDAALAGPRDALARRVYDDRKGDLRPYVDVDRPAFDRHRAALRDALVAAYRDAGLDEGAADAAAADAASGRLDATVVNRYLRQADAFAGDLDPVETADRPRGVSYELLGKRGLFSSMGSRYLVVKPTFDLYAAYRRATEADADALGSVFGEDQRDWLVGRPDAASGGGRRGPDGVLASDATWTVLGSSVSLTSMVLDLADPPDALAEQVARLPEPLRTTFYLNVDQWDGHPNARTDLLRALAERPDGNAVAVSGDIHAAFATRHGATAEFTGPAVSSATLRALVGARVDADPDLAAVEGIEDLVAELDAFLAAANEDVALADSHGNGVLVVEADADALAGTFHHLPAAYSRESYYDRPGALDDVWRIDRFLVDRDGALRQVDTGVSSSEN